MAYETSRRRFLSISGAALATARFTAAQAPVTRKLYTYVGRHTKGPGFGLGGDGGITVFTVNMKDGTLTKVNQTGQEFDDLTSDSMCISAAGRFLYTMYLTPSLRGTAGAGGGVVAFAINADDGSLKHLNTQPSMGANPAAVLIDSTNSRVLVGNHGAVAKIVTVTKRDGVAVIENPTDDATVALFPVRQDGSLEPACDVHVFTRRPLSQTGPGAAVHGLSFDRTERWVIATDNGYDHIYVYPFRANSRRLEGKAFPTPPGRSPRHIVVHPRGPYFFVTNEREASVSSFHFDSDSGDVRAVQDIPTIPVGYSGLRVSPSNIRMHPNGRFIYSANRGDDSVAIVSIDEATGRMTLVDIVKCGGKGPREMNFEPSGRFFFVCNLQSNAVATFVVDANTGQMAQSANADVPRPACVSFAAF